jgi:hypothetical protein
MTENANQKNQWFQDIVNRGLQTFVDYWGYDATIKKWNSGRGISNYYVIENVEHLNNAQLYDPTGLTTFGMLRGHLHETMQGESITYFDLLKNWAKFQKTFSEFRQMNDELESADALEVWATFEQSIRDMGAHYKATEPDALERVIKDTTVLPFIRYSAFSSVEKKLRVNQFLQGDGTTEPFKVHGKIFEFWNINSLIRAAATAQFNGAALCLIRDSEHEFASFFCFAVKAGEVLTILHDKAQVSHPEYNSMSRRPDRDLRSRAEENWFPYQLLEIEPTGEGDRLKMKDRNQLVKYQDELVPLADIGSLDAEQIIWLGSILDLIAKKYGGAQPKLESSLSYTVEMIRRPDALVPAESSLIVQDKYKPLELPVIKAAELTAETAKTKADFEKPSYGHNRHVFERFKHIVPDEALNLIGGDERKLLRESNSELGKMVKKDVWSKEPDTYVVPLKTFSPLEFGTPEQIERDRYWFARYNQISIIDNAAQREFAEKSVEVCKWYKQKVRANKNNLLNAVAALECVVEVGLWRSDYRVIWEMEQKIRKENPDEKFVHITSFPFKDEIVKTKFENILSVWMIDSKTSLWHQTREDAGDVWFGGWENYPYRYVCLDDLWTRAGVAAFFTPTESAHLAILAGVEIDELPEQIRFWNKSDPYVGNSILDRLDPEDWILEDYFKKLNFHVTFTMSKTFINNLRKEHGFPRVKWAEINSKGGIFDPQTNTK